MDSDDDDFSSLPVKPRGGGPIKAVIPQSSNVSGVIDNVDDPFDSVPVVRRGGDGKIVVPPDTGFEDFDDLPIKVRGARQPVDISTTNFDDLPIKTQSAKLLDENFLDDDFGNLPIKPRGAKTSESGSNGDHNDILVQANGTSNDEATREYVACVPAQRRAKGVTFDIENESNLEIKEDSLNESDSGVGSRDSSNGGFAVNGFTEEDLDAQFKPSETAEFMDDLSFLEQCGENDNEAARRQAELARKSLYVRFDPLIKGDSPEKTTNTNLNNSGSSKSNISMMYSLSSTSPSFDDLHPTSEDLSDQTLNKENVGPFGTTKSPRDEKIINGDQKKLLSIQTSSSGLVDPLLYTQSDLDEVVRAREVDWKKKYEELESKIKEEIAMRELLEQDHKEKMECLRKENLNMKQVVAQYEKTIVDLTENSHHNHMFNEETLSETVRAKEQLQQELSTAEQNLVDAYKRIDKLKRAVDTFKQNEEDLKQSCNEFQIKLKRSEERYQKLKQHAAEKVESANVEISKVRKQKEIDLAGLQAALKKAQSKIHSLEQEVQQKVRENAEYAQICDDLIKKVSGE